MGDLYQLSYVSLATQPDEEAEGDHELTLWQLQSIRDAMSRRNEKVGITSAIIFHRGCYAQLLEGPQRALRDCFDRITMDRRHHSVKTIDYAPVTVREVGSPAMIFYDYVSQGLCLLNDEDELVATTAIRCPSTAGVLRRLRGLLAQRAQPLAPSTSLPKLALS